MKNNEEASGYNSVDYPRALDVNPVNSKRKETEEAVDNALTSSTEEYPDIKDYTAPNVREALARVVRQVSEGKEYGLKTFGMNLGRSWEGKYLEIGKEFRIYYDDGRMYEVVWDYIDLVLRVGSQIMGPQGLPSVGTKIFAEMINHFVAYGTALLEQDKLKQDKDKNKIVN